ncbi:MAG: DNA gyrase inhibitor YacG [Candidatus Thiodiazotropha sp.]
MNEPKSAPDTPVTVPCPTCGKAVPWTPDSRWRPFCSERCRLIDLGDWFDEKHRIGHDQEGYSETGDSGGDGTDDISD